MSFGSVLRNIKTIVSKNKLATLFIFLGIFLRFWRISEFATFLGDQGRDAIIIKRIVTFEHFPAIGPPSSVGQIFLGPFYYYLMTPFLVLFHYNPVGLATGVAFISSLGLIGTYWIISNVIDKKTALIFLLFLVFSYVNIELSRFSWNPNLLPLFSFLTLYFFYKLVTTKNTFFAFGSGILLAFSVQLHHLAFFLILPILAVIVQEVIGRKQKGEIFKKLAMSVLGFLIASLPLIIFDLKHGFLNTHNFIRLFTNPNFVSDASYISKVLETTQAFFKNIFTVSLNQTLSLFLFFLFLFIYLVLPKKNHVGVFLRLHVLNVLFFTLIFSFLSTSRLSHYYGIIYYSFFVVLAYYLNLISTKYRVVFVLMIPLLALYVFLNAKNYYFLTGPAGNQVLRAKYIAQTVLDRNPVLPYQVVALPTTETHGHIRYFLEILGKTPLPEDSNTQPRELYVLCREQCNALDDPQWQIAAFNNKKIDTIWQSDGFTIYKIVHER